MRVLFRVDASIEIGTGHLARCRVLADTLVTKYAVDCCFLGRDPDGIFTAMLMVSSHRFFVIPEPATPIDQESDASSHAAWLKRSQTDDLAVCKNLLGDDWPQFDWLVVDHYAIDACWERQFPGRVLAIDDLADRPHEVDLLLDQNLRLDDGREYGRLAPGARKLIGPKFALLRQEFSQGDAGRSESSRGNTKRLFVCFGGVDKEDFTRAAVSALLRDSCSTLLVDVVVGTGYRYRNSLETTVDGNARFSIHVDPPDIVGLMRQADLAIGAAGSMTWERCAIGLPALAVAIADNQVELVRAAAEASALIAVEREVALDAPRMAALIAGTAEDDNLLGKLGDGAYRLCDGKGAERVAAQMKELA